MRIYAEAATQLEADELAERVSQFVYEYGHGVGDRP